jgi:hypothetical protein
MDGLYLRGRAAELGYSSKKKTRYSKQFIPDARSRTQTPRLLSKCASRAGVHHAQRPSYLLSYVDP